MRAWIWRHSELRAHYWNGREDPPPTSTDHDDDDDDDDDGDLLGKGSKNPSNPKMQKKQFFFILARGVLASLAPFIG